MEGEMNQEANQFEAVEPGSDKEAQAEREQWPMFELGEEVVVHDYVFEVAGAEGKRLKLDGLRRYRPCPDCAAPMAPSGKKDPTVDDRAEEPWECPVCASAPAASIDTVSQEPEQSEGGGTPYYGPGSTAPGSGTPTEPPAPDTDPSESDPVDAAIAGAEEAALKPPTEGDDKPFVG